MEFHSIRQSRIQEIPLDFVNLPGSKLSLLREDELHPLVSGNKFRKLKYNLLEAKKLGFTHLLSFGGAHSNHILALAAAGKEHGFKTIGVIRGEELEDSSLWGPTLKNADSYGMQLHFVSRKEYQRKDTEAFMDGLRKKFPDFFLIPEGGSNEAAVKGCAEILDQRTKAFDAIAVAVGTGGTLAGLAKAKSNDQRLIGFSALNGCFQKNFIAQFAEENSFELIDSYSFGGYAKIDSDLIRFINTFHEYTGVPLDPVYTGKMMYGIMDMLRNGKFHRNNRILAIHTGGLQGIEAMNSLLKKKNLPQISF